MGTLRRLALALTAGAFLLVVPAAAANDSFVAPTPLSFGVAATEGTAAYGIEPGEQNTTSFPNDCGSGHPVGAARTAWFSVQGTGGQVTITTDGSTFDTSLFVYSGSPAGSLVGCNDDTSASDFQSTVTFSSTAGTTYAIQAGSACNLNGGGDPAFACATPPVGGTLKITAIGVVPPPPPPPNHDVDGDGFLGAQFGGPDCNDGNPAIHPGAADIPHDGIDQDCSGADAPYPALTVVRSIDLTYYDTYTRIKTLRVTAPAGSTVVLSCSTKKKGCPFRSRTVAVAGPGPVSLAKVFKRAKLRKGSVVTVRVTKTGYIGAFFRYKLAIKRFTLQTRCLEPGATAPQTTCS